MFAFARRREIAAAAAAVSVGTFALAAGDAIADVELRVARRSQEIAERAELGVVAVDGIGAVSVVAQREGKKVVLRAGGPDGKAVGKAEAPVGLARTPIYVQTPTGLEEIIVVWGAELPSER